MQKLPANFIQQVRNFYIFTKIIRHILTYKQ